MKRLFAEFKEFIMRGNVLDMAVGVIIATAFGAITSSLINDILMPFISWVIGAQDMSALNITVRAANEAAGQEAIVLGFGTLISAIINFILVALVIFTIVKSFNRAKELAEAKKKKEEDAAPADPEPSAEAKLLTEIRDLLKKQ